ncbi:hypothetical protein [Acinetobacter radioresistens]|uniref:hypothetical protein n=1 Tax=Acinetobacter radioresistens TaxID=40216 RepID=UPI0020069983|nr:hypothetical protein [Acinetobacter radioresistens]MCK4081820.1 hypothetical protein [Acinetobacter radioresistens]MCU4607595.1 hypothetical protein [Acinetobacter radioresistens]HAV5332179.1 hypothetical protein [Acinetobacter baumannii]
MKNNISSLAYVAKQQKHAELLKTARNGKTCYFVKISGYYPNHLDRFYRINKASYEFIEVFLTRSDSYLTIIKGDLVRHFKSVRA